MRMTICGALVALFMAMPSSTGPPTAMNTIACGEAGVQYATWTTQVVADAARIEQQEAALQATTAVVEAENTSNDTTNPAFTVGMHEEGLAGIGHTDEVGTLAFIMRDPTSGSASMMAFLMRRPTTTANPDSVGGARILDRS